MKKSISFITLIFLVLSLLAGCNVGSDELDPASPNPVSDFEYEVNKDGGITITKYVGTDKSVVIPAQIENKNVTIIGRQAFRGSVIVSVHIPNTVLEIDYYAFADCKELKVVVLCENLTKIGEGAFSECSALCEIELPNSITVLEECCFQYCTALKSIEIPGSVENIRRDTFFKSGLENVKFNDGLKIIYENAFSATKLSEVIFPSSLKIIGSGAFASCDLVTISLNEGLEEIYPAFDNNVNLRTIVIPSTVTSLDLQSFSRCISLESVYFKGNAPHNNSVDLSQDFMKGIDYTVYYLEGAEGFTSPEWYGYKTEIWE